ncbi:MAG: ABC transporter permease [Candidatus Sericytochromatia bacterium]|nr:ABC transporter permease [Candidatus Sericytochromatia bacterium]
MVTSRQKIWRRFRRHRLALIGGVILAVFYFMALFANFFSPYGEATDHRKRAYAPPTKVYFATKAGPSAPYMFEVTESFDAEKKIFSFKEDRTQPYPLQFFVHGEPYHLLGLIPTDIHLVGVAAPARLYLLGADIQGRDIFSRLLFGARISMTVGIVAILFSYPIGMMIGGTAGYYGGTIDNILMRIVEAVMAFPTFFLLLALAASLPPSLSSIERYLLITVILSFVSWAGQARIIRGMVLSIRQQEYVEAAKAAGATDLSIIVKHILPQTASWIIISASLAIPLYTLTEAGLSFLGLGIQDPQASWGNMLQEAREPSALLLHPWLLSSGVALVIAVIAYNLFGDGLRDAFDTKKKV